MDERSAITPADRVTAVFEPDPAPALRCSHCAAAITDDDAVCPTCQSPIDWGASMHALTRWQESIA
jgi:hypothetical protein